MNKRVRGDRPFLHKARRWQNRIPRGVLLAGSFCVSVTLVAGVQLTGSHSAAAVSPSFSISTSPALDPPFNPAVSDYVVHCTSQPTSVTTTGSDPVTIAGTTLPGPA